MPSLEPINNNSQPENKLSAIAEAERKKLLPKNDYKTGNQYSTTNPDAMADGDKQGKGTGGFLDVYNQNAGAIQDVLERKNEVKLNSFSPNKPYTTPSA